MSPKTTNSESESKFVFVYELIELYVLLRKHIVISKNVSDDVFDRLLTNNQCPFQKSTSITGVSSSTLV